VPGADLGTPGLDIVHLIDRVDHRAARQQLAEVVAAAIEEAEYAVLDAVKARKDADVMAAAT
jgi:hypothetical protein